MSALPPYSKIGLLRPLIDVHTLGIYNVAELLSDCKIYTAIADEKICKCVENLDSLSNRSILKTWIEVTGIKNISMSYRLDPEDGFRYFYKFFKFLKEDNLLVEDNGRIRNVYFSGLPETAKRIEKFYKGRVVTFWGGESPAEVLLKLGLSDEYIPDFYLEEDDYDKLRFDIAEDILKDFDPKKVEITEYDYPDYGKDNDNLLSRIEFSYSKKCLPILRAHVGPYNENRKDAINEFITWIDNLKERGLLDILSIGTSQLTQSNFEEKWTFKENGGGLPIQNRAEYFRIWQRAKPMLVRTYAGTKNISSLANIYEKYLNIAWHAFSFWWFNILDGRGSLSMEEGLREFFDAMEDIRKTNKAIEANTQHHFAFRGADDVTFIVSGYIAAKAVKQSGVKNFIMQNMFNTPKLTWGKQDLAKARAGFHLIKNLEDKNFNVYLQTRAGLSYFSTDLDFARKQLVADSLMFDDVEFNNTNNPQIVHVVSYCEACFLATPKYISESLELTKHALAYYRNLKKKEGFCLPKKITQEIDYRTNKLIDEAKLIISAIEKTYINPYSAEGLANIFKDGWLPVPYLWGEREKYVKSTTWKTKFLNGGYTLVDQDGQKVDSNRRIEILLNK